MLYVIQHQIKVPTGTFGPLLEDHDATVVSLEGGAGFPALTESDRLVVLGGSMGAYDEDRYSWLVPEKRWLTDALDREIPVLGICLGSQLLAEVAGGSAYRAPHMELALAPFSLTDAAVSDPVASMMEGRRFLTYHYDTFDLPSEAVLLASSDDYPQAFSVGSAFGFQAHPEITPEIAATWFRNDGIDAAEVLTEIQAHVSDLAANGRRFLEAWLASTSTAA